MQIDENTRYIARLHTKPSPRGLNIYNPFLEESGLNTLYVLHYDEDPKPLIKGLKDFNFLGGITAGFESNVELPTLLDELDPVSKFVQRVGYIKNVNGRLTGYSQGGEGLLRAIQEKCDINNKEVVIVGAGIVAKGLLFNIQERGLKPIKITLLNRTVEKAEELVKSLNLDIVVKPLGELEDTKGDVLINITDIGGSEEDTLYTEAIVQNFSCISDVTFEKEDTNLLNIAKKFNKITSSGWDMFTHQGLVILENLFEQKMDVDMFRKHVRNGLSTVVK
jgi:shikimate dehydrogenase